MRRIQLIAPDNGPIIRSNEQDPIPFFSSGGAMVFGVWMRAAIINNGNHPRALPNFQPGTTVALRLDGFLSQPVLALFAKMVSRKDAIEYTANVAGGFHSGAPKEPIHHLPNRIRHGAKFNITPVPADL